MEIHVCPLCVAGNDNYVPAGMIMLVPAGLPEYIAAAVKQWGC